MIKCVGLFIEIKYKLKTVTQRKKRSTAYVQQLYPFSVSPIQNTLHMDIL
jgi:hypothetical protein